MRSRFAVVALVMVLIVAAVLVVGCGSSGVEEPATDTTAQTPAAPAAPASTVAAETAAADRSPTETVVYEPFPTDPQVTPKAVLDLIQAKQPMVVYFYDSTQKTTDDQSKGVDGEGGLTKIMSDYRGTVDLVSFDVGRYMKTSSTGAVRMDAEFVGDSAAQQAASLGAALGVDFTPYVVIVDGDGYIISRFRGWEDIKDIEREVLRATS
jgi:hypothetical protein